MSGKTDALMAARREKLSKDPKTLAWWFAQYEALTGATDADLCKMLNINKRQLTGVSFCDKPKEDDDLYLVFMDEFNKEKFAEIIRYVEEQHGEN